MSIACVVALLALPATYREAKPLPKPTVPYGLGVNIHFTQESPGEVALIRAGGIRWVRMDFTWHSTEKVKGKYDFSAYDQLMSSLDKNGVRPYFILDYGNDLYQKGSPNKPETRKAFCNWVSAAVAHFRHRGIVWEMWNEPNIGFWQPKPNVDEYAALALEVGKTIRKTAPDEWYIGPATSGFDWAFLAKCFDSGLLKYWDAVSVHPYRGSEPESVLSDWNKLRSMINAKGSNAPMISGEWGYSELYSGLSQDLQGRYAPRQYLSNLIGGANLHIQYDWKDDGADPKEPEHHFGTVSKDLQPKLAYNALKTLSTALEGFTYRYRLTQANPRSFVTVFTKGAEVRFVAWTSSPTEKPILELPLPGAGQITLTSPLGILPSSNDPEVFSIELSSMPIVITPKNFAATSVKSLAKWQPLPKSIIVSKSNPYQNVLAQLKSYGDLPSYLPAFSPIQDRPIMLQVSMRGNPRFSQSVELIPGNPVTFTVRPAVGKVHASVIINNPSGQAFNGQLGYQVDQMPTSMKVVIPTGKTSAEITIPGIRVSDFAAAQKFGLTINGEPVRSTNDVFSIPIRLSTSLERSELKVYVDGDNKIPASIKGEITSGMGDLPLGNVVKLSYSFEPGWRFLCLSPSNPIAIAGSPKSLGMYVYGDASGHMLRMRYIDSTGQTFQPDYGPVDWKGWKWITFDLNNPNVGHWGGAKDSVIHYPIQIETLGLLDSAGGKGGSGEIGFAGFAIYR